MSDKEIMRRFFSYGTFEPIMVFLIRGEKYKIGADKGGLMGRYTKKVSGKIGLPPGAVISTGDKKTEKTSVTLFDYNEKAYTEKPIEKLEEILPFKDKPTVSWINLDSIQDAQAVETLNNFFGIHPLILEDIVSSGQRPKFEDFEDYIFMVFNMLTYDEKKGEVVSEQVSLVFGENYVISFQEHKGDVFEIIRERIRNGKGRVRKMGADYLAYALLDAVVDHYFLVLEKLGDQIEVIEESVMKEPDQETMKTIHAMKREMIFLRKAVWPLRELISGFQRVQSKLVRAQTEAYLRDVYDHTIQIIDTIESFRDMLSGTLDTYLSSVSNRMNEVMKVLTIMATIFIPLSFFAGVYGMNFEHMPELSWKYSYLVFWLFIIAAGTSMVVYFKKKKWM